MNRELIVSLLQKQIEELKLMTEGFMDMETYPDAIMKLALLKNDDIRDFLHQLSNLNVQYNLTEETNLLESEPFIEENIAEKTVFETEESSKIVAVEENADVETIEEEVSIEEVIIDEVTIEEEEEEAAIGEEVNVAENEEDIDATKEIVQEEHNVVHAKVLDEIVEEFEDLEEENTEEEIELVTVIEETPIIITSEPEKANRPTMTRNDILNANDVSLNSSLGSKKISDIRQAISIGDRFRFQRELFRNNGEDMNKTLIYINQLASYEEVFHFLQSKYGWESDNSNADDFYQIVKRKF